MITSHDVDIAYVDLLAKLGESNRPPGGMRALQRLLSTLALRPGAQVLHAGCNAGFLSREVARRTGATVVGIDINRGMVEAGARRAKSEGLAGLVSHQVADMRALPFDDNQFDVVLSGGALAFVDGRHREALAEWRRVCRPHGLIADIELFYARTPPAEMLARVSRVIGVEVPRYSEDYWIELFTSGRSELYSHWRIDEPLNRGHVAVETWVDDLLEFAHERVAPAARSALRNRLIETFSLFDDNLAYLSAVGLVVVNRPHDFEPTLYP